jgi:FkbM family methyltransferase
LKIIWNNLLKISAFRKAILTHLHSSYFHEFHHSIPLGNDYWAHLWESDAYDSISEIFIQQEYSDYIPDEPLGSVLDLGAHYGYFSLWLQSKRPQEQIYSTMVEPSRRCQRSLEKLVEPIKLKNRFKYLQSAVSNPKQEKTRFHDRPFMGGSLFESSSAECSYDVKTLLSSDVLDQNKTFDLVKCDLEGAEWQLLTNYPDLLRNSLFITMEWHSWHAGGGGFPQIERELKVLGFKIIKNSTPAKAIGKEGEVGLFLAKNCNFEI